MGPIAKSTLRTSLILSLRLLIQAGTLLLVARILGPTSFGVFTGIGALAVLLGAFSTFGTHIILLKDYSENKKKDSRVLSYAFPTTLIFGSILFLLFLGLNYIFLDNLNVSMLVLISIGVSDIILLPFFLLSTIYFLAIGRTAFSQFLGLIPLLFRFFSAFIIICLELEESLEYFSLFYLITTFLSVIGIWFFFPETIVNFNKWKLPKKKHLKKSFGYAVLNLTSLGPTELDKILAVKLLPLGISGIYVAGSRVIGAAVLPVIALLLSALPRLFRESKDEIKNKKLISWIFISVVVYGFILMTLIFVFSAVVEKMFGTKYIGIAEMLIWLSFVVPGLALRIAIGNILMTMNQPWFRALLELIGVVVLGFVVFILFTFFRGGVVSLALSLVISEWLMAVLGAFFILWKIKK